MVFPMDGWAQSGLASRQPKISQICLSHLCKHVIHSSCLITSLLVVPLSQYILSHHYINKSNFTAHRWKFKMSNKSLRPSSTPDPWKSNFCLTKKISVKKNKVCSETRGDWVSGDAVSFHLLWGDLRSGRQQFAKNPENKPWTSWNTREVWFSEN